MYDLHSHYIYDVDDGSKTLKQTREMLEYAAISDVKKIIFTPHYIVDSKYISSKEDNYKKFKKIKKIAKEYDIKVYLGNEIYVCENILELIEKGLVSTLNDSRYVLIEIPMYSMINNIKDIFDELLAKGYIPILAHPERYTYYYKKMDFFIELHEMGVLFQINLPSITGMYGRQAKVMAKKLLKAHLVEFVGSDLHSEHEKKYDCIDKASKKIVKYVGEQEAKKILYKNFNKVIKNEDL